MKNNNWNNINQFVTHYQPKRSFFDLDPPIKIRTSQIVPFSCEEVCQVVAAVNEYKEFVPFCIDSKIIRSDGNDFICEVVIGYNGSLFSTFQESYISVVTTDWPYKVTSVANSNDTFKFLVNEWRFVPRGKKECELHFAVDVKFNTSFYTSALRLLFCQISERQMWAFEKRCKERYRSSSSSSSPLSPPSTLTHFHSPSPVSSSMGLANAKLNT